MTKLFIATSSAPVGDFPSVLPLLALHMTGQDGGSFAVVDTGLEQSWLHLFVECERLSLTTPVSVAAGILRAHEHRDVVLFDAKHFGDDDVFRLILLMHAAKLELDRQGRRPIALVPFSDDDLDAKQTAYANAAGLHRAGFEVRLVFCNLDKRDYFAPVSGIDMVHGSIPPLGAGLIDLIMRERRTLHSLLENPPENFAKAIEHIRDWLSRCRQSKAFCDLAAPVIPPPERLLPGGFPYLTAPRIPIYWTVDTLADAADDPAKLQDGS